MHIFSTFLANFSSCLAWNLLDFFALYTCNLEILNLTGAVVDSVQRLSGKFSALEHLPPSFNVLLWEGVWR